MRKNKEVAEMLREIADLLELKGVEFKPRAYRKAAMSIESMGESIEAVHDENRLEDIPGVGESIGQKIDEFLRSGKSKYLRKLQQKTPIDVHALSEIQGIGPKTIQKLYKKLKIKSVQELERAAKEQRIRKIKGFGPKLEEKILQGVSFHKTKEDRMLLGAALPTAEDLLKELKGCKHIGRLSLAGSIRRRKKTIGDIDLLVTTREPTKVMEFVTSRKSVQRVLAKGKKKSSIVIHPGIQVDVRIVEPNSWGAALQYFTGSKEHSIQTRKIAIKKGYKLNEYGLFKGDKRIASKTEAQVYKKLGMQYPPPELREAQGEVEAAQKKRLPDLIELRDIKGDAHIHSKFSDGATKMEEMIKAARELKRKYLVMTDHTGKLKIAGAMGPDRIRKYCKQIDRLQKRSPIRIFKGAEVNIDKEGNPDLPDKVLQQFDLCVGSVHGAFQQSRKKMTNRICKAMEHEKINIIGHPTGRMIHERKGYELDWQRIFEQARNTKTALEINAQPSRLDLDPGVAREAIEHGVKLVISTDAHQKEQLQFMRYGVYMARRAWAEQKHVLNTRSASQFLKSFR